MHLEEAFNKLDGPARRLKQRRALNGLAYAAIRRASSRPKGPLPVTACPPSMVSSNTDSASLAAVVTPSLQAAAHRAVSAPASVSPLSSAPVAKASLAAATIVETPLMPSAQVPPSPSPSSPPLLLVGAGMKASGSVFKLMGHVGRHKFTALLDSGASGPGFINPAFAARCGLSLKPSPHTVQLADGTIVPAAGETSVDFTLRPTKGSEIEFTSQFTATPLENYDIILGVGWLEEHDVNVGWRERTLEVRTAGKAIRHIRPIDRFAELNLTKPEQLATITAKKMSKELREGKLEVAYAVFIRPEQKLLGL